MNASWELARQWALSEPDVRAICLPVVRGEAPKIARVALEEAPAPRLYLALGELRRQSGPDVPIRLEKVAINWDDFRIPDNAGNQPRDTPIREGGPAAHFASVSPAALVRALEGKTPHPVEVSLSAGSFLCNHLAYCIRDVHPELPFLFVHVPAWRPEDGEAKRETLAATLAMIGEKALGEVVAR